MNRWWEDERYIPKLMRFMVYIHLSVSLTGRYRPNKTNRTGGVLSKYNVGHCLKEGKMPTYHKITYV